MHSYPGIAKKCKNINPLTPCIGELLYKLPTNHNYCYAKSVLFSKNCYAFPPNISALGL